MRGGSRLAALVCLICYVFVFCTSRGSCGTNGGASSGEPDSSTSFNCCNSRAGGSRRRGRWYQRLCSCLRSVSDRSSSERRTSERRTSERRTSEGLVLERRTREPDNTSGGSRGFAALLAPRVTAGQEAIAAMSRLRGEYTPSCDFPQRSLATVDYTAQWQRWESATPVGTAHRYAVLHPPQTRPRIWPLTHNYPVIAHRGCAIVEVTKAHGIGVNTSSGAWLLEIYPTVVSDTQEDDVTKSISSDLIPFLTRGLQYYRQSSVVALRSSLKVLLPAAVLERVRPVQYATDPPSTLARVALLRWRSYGNLKDFIDSLYEKQIIYKNVTSKKVHAALLSIMQQVTVIVARLHMQGLIIGDLTAEMFVVGESGLLYLDGMKHLRQALNLTIPEWYSQVLHSPPEVSSGEATSFSFATDGWQLGFLLLQLWCGGFRSPDESLWDMRQSKAMVSYFQVRAGLAAAIDFDGCIEGTDGLIKNLISSLLKYKNRFTPEQMVHSADFAYMSELIA